MGLAMHGFFGPPVGADPATAYKDEMQSFWRDAESKTQRLLQEHWDEVEKIAQELLIQGDLSGKDVVKLIKEASSSNGHHPEEAKEIASEVIEEAMPEMNPKSGD